MYAPRHPPSRASKEFISIVPLFPRWEVGVVLCICVRINNVTYTYRIHCKSNFVNSGALANWKLNYSYLFIYLFFSFKTFSFKVRGRDLHSNIFFSYGRLYALPEIITTLTKKQNKKCKVVVVVIYEFYYHCMWHIYYRTRRISVIRWAGRDWRLLPWTYCTSQPRPGQAKEQQVRGRETLTGWTTRRMRQPLWLYSRPVSLGLWSGEELFPGAYTAFSPGGGGGLKNMWVIHGIWNAPPRDSNQRDSRSIIHKVLHSYQHIFLCFVKSLSGCGTMYGWGWWRLCVMPYRGSQAG